MKEQIPIPCSVGMLTLNCADSLPACLHSLQGFAEIIVCDGNSTDGTREIAEKAGARVINQYDTDEPDVRCAMDKAAVRERNMAAASNDWYFFMDADDTLSPEAVDEIRTIVTDPAPKHLIWRMPTRVFIEGKEILHEATYPSYQTRLVHRSVGAHFKGPVHDHFVWDASRFPAGEMRSYYNFQWPEERVVNFWRYQLLYIRRELQTAEFQNFAQYLRWGVWFRLRIIAGYVLWRLPAMYARFGFRDSMPLSLELQIIGYHVGLLFGSVVRYVTTRRWWIYATEAVRGGMSGARAAAAARAYEAYGRTLLVGDERDAARVMRHARQHRWHRLTVIKPRELPSAAENHFDTIIWCASEQPPHDVAERMRRIVRTGGTVYGG